MASAPAVKPMRFRSSGMRPALEKPSSTDDLDRAARRGDRVARAGAEGVRPDRERMRQRALAEALEQAALADKPARAQLVGTDHGAGLERAELPDVEDDVLGARHGPEAALRQATLERHLAALVPRRDVAARARPLALVPAAGRLAVAGAGPAPDALARTRGAWRRMQMTKVHRLSPPSRPGGRPWRACRGRLASPSGSPSGRAA